MALVGEMPVQNPAKTVVSPSVVAPVADPYLNLLSRHC